MNCCGANCTWSLHLALDAYIRNQRQHHKKVTFEQEFLALLKKAGVPYDPKYVLG